MGGWGWGLGGSGAGRGRGEEAGGYANQASPLRRHSQRQHGCQRLLLRAGLRLQAVNDAAAKVGGRLTVDGEDGEGGDEGVQGENKG